MTKKLSLILIIVAGVLAVGCSGGGEQAPNVPSEPGTTPTTTAPGGGSQPSFATPQKAPPGPDGGPP